MSSASPPSPDRRCEAPASRRLDPPQARAATPRSRSTGGPGLGVPADSIAPADASTRFGPFLGTLAALDSPASAAVARRLLGWEPTGAGLLEDLEQESATLASPS